jgi:uncharacterized protein YndB with AHSA1/START domain
MTNAKVSVVAQGDRELVISREFRATRDLVFRAHTECKYLKRWLFGPDGWALDVCEIDLKVGGKYRWVWRKEAENIDMGAGGEYREIVPNELIVATEQFDDPWYEGEAISTVEFSETDGVTLLTNTMRYSSKEARDGVLASPMAEGMELGYGRLDKMFSEMSAAA